jgi:hypothetical protein
MGGRAFWSALWKSVAEAERHGTARWGYGAGRRLAPSANPIGRPAHRLHSNYHGTDEA